MNGPTFPEGYAQVTAGKFPKPGDRAWIPYRNEWGSPLKKDDCDYRIMEDELIIRKSRAKG